MFWKCCVFVSRGLHGSSLEIRSSQRVEEGDEIVGWHHWLNGHESEQTLRDKPGVLQSTGLQRVGHNLVTEQQQQSVSIPGLEGPSYLTLWCFSSLGWGQGWEWPNTALCLIWSSHSSGHPAAWSCLFAESWSTQGFPAESHDPALFLKSDPTGMPRPSHTSVWIWLSTFLHQLSVGCQLCSRHLRRPWEHGNEQDGQEPCFQKAYTLARWCKAAKKKQTRSGHKKMREEGRRGKPWMGGAVGLLQRRC